MDGAAFNGGAPLQTGCVDQLELVVREGASRLEATEEHDPRELARSDGRQRHSDTAGRHVGFKHCDG
jgi:hypothetical protein